MIVDNCTVFRRGINAKLSYIPLPNAVVYGALDLRSHGRKVAKDEYKF